MATYAVLGARGRIGNSVLQVLSESPDKKVRAFVRSRKKLQQMSPQICCSENITIFEGDIQNTAILRDCIIGTHAVFLTVAASSNIPGCRVAQNQVEAIVSVLESNRSEDAHARLPTLVMRSSAETEKRLCQNIPWPVRSMLFAAHSRIYLDLIEAEKYLRARDDWVTSVFVKPGGLSYDIQRGHIISTEKQQTFLSYVDLAAAMLEIADTEGGRWDGESVSVLSHGKAKVEWSVALTMAKGLLFHFFPSLYPWLSE